MEKTETAGMIKNMLLSQRVKLRAVEPADIEFLYHLENDPVTWRAGNTITPFSRFQIEQYVYSTEHDIYSEKQLRLMIETTCEKKCIGAVDLFEFDPHHRRAGIGILIVTEEREKGYAAEAVEIMKKYSSQVLRLHQLYCSVAEGNEASVNLFEKAGFISTGIKKDWRYQDNDWNNEIFYQFLF